MKKCWRRSKQQISSQKWYKVRLWYLGLIFQLGFTWPVLYFTKLTLAMERTKCRAALTEASTAFWNTNPCHSSIQIHVSGSAQSMFLSLAKKKNASGSFTVHCRLASFLQPNPFLSITRQREEITLLPIYTLVLHTCYSPEFSCSLPSASKPCSIRSLLWSRPCPTHNASLLYYFCTLGIRCKCLTQPLH